MSDFAKVMPFGKYKGQPIATIPKGYLNWLAENVKLKPFIAGAVYEAIGREYKRKQSKPVPSIRCIGRNYVPSDDDSCPFDIEEESPHAATSVPQEGQDSRERTSDPPHGPHQPTEPAA